MKKNIGSALALYPTPVVVAGTMAGEKPTWTLVAMRELSDMTGSWSV